MSEQFQITIKGFKTKAQAKAFYDWYENQGESDSPYWFEERQLDGEIDVSISEGVEEVLNGSLISKILAAFTEIKKFFG